MNALLKFVKTTVMGGLLFLVPLALLGLILERALAVAENVVIPLAHHFPNTPVFGVSAVTLAAASMLLIVSFVAGLFARTATGQALVSWVEQTVLTKMPGYLMFRSIVGDIANIESLQGDATQRVVMVRVGEGWQIAFVVDEPASGELAVFVPGAPSPLAGSLRFMSREAVRPSQLSVKEANAILRRIGVGASSRIATSA